MTAKEQDLEMNVGETKKIIVENTEDEDGDGYLKITGRQELKWQMLHYKGGPTVVEKTESDPGLTVTDETIGAYEVNIEPEDTENVFKGDKDEFYHRVRITDSDGDVSDLLEGEITVHAV